MAHRSGFSLGYGDGGNSYMAAAYLLRWAGPVTEAADPYAPYASSPNPSPENAAVGTHVHEFLELPSRSGATDNDDLKWAVMTYGAVYTSMYWKAAAFRDASDAYYFSGSSGANHAVTLVGWDDAYPASRFASPPAGPGAFLVRNSWGTVVRAERLLLGLLLRHHLRDRQRGLRRRRDGDGRRADLPARPARLGRLVPPARRRRSGHGVVRRGVHGGGGRHADAAGFYATAPDAAYEVRIASSVEGIADAPVAATGILAVPGYHTVTLDAPVAWPPVSGWSSPYASPCPATASRSRSSGRGPATRTPPRLPARAT